MRGFSVFFIAFLAACASAERSCYQCLSADPPLSSSEMLIIQGIVGQMQTQLNQTIELPPLCGVDGSGFKDTDTLTCSAETCYSLNADIHLDVEVAHQAYTGTIKIKTCGEKGQVTADTCNTISPTTKIRPKRNIDTSLKMNCFSCQEDLCNFGTMHVGSVTLLLIAGLAKIFV